MTGDLFQPAEIPFNLKGELLDNALTVEGQRRLDAEREAEARKAQIQIPFNPNKRRPHESRGSAASNACLGAY